MTASDALWCVVPAAGRSTRVGGEVPKQYLTIAGKPLLQHTLERLAAHPRIGGFVVVHARDDVWLAQLSLDLRNKPMLTAIGGAERADSVLAGLAAIRERCDTTDYVLVHDAARPCVALADISRLLDLGVPAGGALLAAPVRDTLKLADAHARVAATEPREARWRAQTPQMFRYGELVDALEAARADAVAITDEAMAMEQTGFRPLLVEGSEDNIKVTTRADLALAEFLLTRQER